MNTNNTGKDYKVAIVILILSLFASLGFNVFQLHQATDTGAQYEEAISLHDTEKAEFKDRIAKLEDSVSSLNDKNKKLEASVKSKNTTISDLESEIADLKRTIRGNEDEIDDLNDIISEYKSKQQSTYTAPTYTEPTYASPSTSAYYIGNKETKKFHLPSCSYLPSLKNRIRLSSRSYAISRGYSPCGHCDP